VKRCHLQVVLRILNSLYICLLYFHVGEMLNLPVPVPVSIIYLSNNNFNVMLCYVMWYISIILLLNCINVYKRIAISLPSYYCTTLTGTWTLIKKRRWNFDKIVMFFFCFNRILQPFVHSWYRCLTMSSDWKNCDKYFRKIKNI